MNRNFRVMASAVLFSFLVGGLVAVAAAEKVKVKFTKNARVMLPFPCLGANAKRRITT